MILRMKCFPPLISLLKYLEIIDLYPLYLPFVFLMFHKVVMVDDNLISVSSYYKPYHFIYCGFSSAFIDE